MSFNNGFGRKGFGGFGNYNTGIKNTQPILGGIGTGMINTSFGGNPSCSSFGNSFNQANQFYGDPFGEYIDYLSTWGNNTLSEDSNIFYIKLPISDAQYIEYVKPILETEDLVSQNVDIHGIKCYGYRDLDRLKNSTNNTQEVVVKVEVNIASVVLDIQDSKTIKDLYMIHKAINFGNESFKINNEFINKIKTRCQNQYNKIDIIKTQYNKGKTKRYTNYYILDSSIIENITIAD